MKSLEFFFFKQELTSHGSLQIPESWCAMHYDTHACFQLIYILCFAFLKGSPGAYSNGRSCNLYMYLNNCSCTLQNVLISFAWISHNIAPLGISLFHFFFFKIRQGENRDLKQILNKLLIYNVHSIQGSIKPYPPCFTEYSNI